MDFTRIKDRHQAYKEALALGIDLDMEKHDSWGGHILSCIFENVCEERLEQPVFVIGYPVEISPLAKTNQDDPRLQTDLRLLSTGKRSPMLSRSSMIPLLSGKGLKPRLPVEREAMKKHI